MGIMKNIILVSLLFIACKTVNAFDAIVIVLEAPLLKEPTLNSVVLQTLRKGERVYVPTEIGSGELPEFIQTYDRVGNVAYIPKKYIKIITNEVSENKMPISYPGSDPTDYRLEEPIPTTYPFDNSTFLRANLSFSLGNSSKTSYDYNSVYSSQEATSETGARFNLTHKVAFDKYDRYYFGLFGAVSTNNNKIAFINNNLAEENRSMLRLGPIITYDAFKSSHYRLTLGTGFTYNYLKSALKVTAANGNSEERLFTGYSLSPFANSTLQVVDIVPNLDLIGGADLNFYLPHSQTNKSEITFPDFWGTDSPNQISSGFKTQVSFFLGIQVKY
jgi:hypothetical protein